MIKYLLAFFVLLSAVSNAEAHRERPYNPENYDTVGAMANERSGTYDQFVVTPHVAVMYVEGILRFCPRENLRGRICGQEGRMFGLFGKKSFMPMDWFSPETYVTAVTGLPSITVTRIGPTPDGEGLIIYYR